MAGISRDAARVHALERVEWLRAATDLACQGMSRYARKLVAQGVTEHVAFWHSDHTGKRNHTWKCSLYADSENIVFGKNPNFSPCPQCMDDEDAPEGD